MVWSAMLTALLTALVAGLMTVAGPVDGPRERGAHHVPTPTAGGLAVIAGVAAGLMLFVVLERPYAGFGLAVWLFACAAALGLMGGLDDVFDFGAMPKLIAQIAVCLAFSALVARVEVLPLAPGLALQLGPVLGALGTALWLVVVVNAYNFMDGADGLAGGVQSIALFTLALVNPDRPVLAFLLLAASIANLAFLPFNHPGRRLFQGDCGALFSAFLIGGATVLLASEPRPSATLYLGVFVSAPFLTDVLLTLLARARAGKRLFQAHNEHLYQRWLAATGRPHGALAWRVWLLSAACAAVGFIVDAAAPEWSLTALALLIAALSLGWNWLSRRLEAAAALRPAG